MIGNPSKGGAVTAAESRAKAKALNKLHRSRRGVRINTLGIPEGEWLKMIGEIRQMLNRRAERRRVSRRAIAAKCNVSDRTIRRWMDQIHWPTAAKVRALARWLLAVRD